MAWNDYFPEYYGGFGNASAPWNESTGSGGGSWIPKETIPGGGNPYGLFAPSDANPTWPQYDPSLSPWDWGPWMIPNWPGGGGGPMPVPEPPVQPTLPTPPAVPPPMPEPTGVPTYRTEGTAPRPADTRDKVTAAAAGGSLAAAIAGILRGSGTGRDGDNPVIRTTSPTLPGDQPTQPPSVPPVLPPAGPQPQVPDEGVPTYSVTRTEPRQTSDRTTPPVVTRADIPYEPVAIKPPGIFPPIITDAPTPPVLEEPVIPPPVLPPVTDPTLPGYPTTPEVPVKLPGLPNISGMAVPGSGAPLPGPFAPLVGAGPTQSVFQNNYRPSPVPSIGELLSQFAQIYGGR